MKKILIGLYLAGVCLFSVSYVREVVSSSYRGFPLFYGSDESHYIVRLQEGLLAGDTTNGIFSGPTTPHGLQPGGVERIVGFLFSWTGWSGTTVMIVLSVLFAPLMLPITTLLARRAGCRFPWCIGVALLFVFLFLTPLRRFVHQSWSLPLTALTLLSIVAWWQCPSRRSALVAGVFLGLLPHVYLWSWTFSWTVAGILLITVLLERPRSDLHTKTLLFLALPIALISAPYFFTLIQNLGNPLSSDIADRSSVVHSRGIESTPRFILTLLIAVASLSYGWIRRERNHASLPFFAAGVAGFIVLHQQFIHGTVISFSTHYYPVLCLSVLLLSVAVIVERRRTIETLVIVAVSSILLFAAFVDYHGRASVFFPKGSFAYQHLKDAYPVPLDGVRETVLTDRDTSLVIAANTDDDVVFTEHLRHVLIPMSEYAERYCLSDTFQPEGTDPRWLPAMLVELIRLGRQRDQELFSERTMITDAACTAVRKDPTSFFRKYGVTMVLWNERSRPDWVMDPRLVRLERRGEGWSVWRPVNP